MSSMDNWAPTQEMYRELEQRLAAATKDASDWKTIAEMIGTAAREANRLLVDAKESIKALKRARDAANSILDQIADIVGVDKSKRSGEELVAAVRRSVEN